LPGSAGWANYERESGEPSLRFHPSFGVCTTLAALRDRIARETPEYERWGIHGLVSQTAQGELTLGDAMAAKQFGDRKCHQNQAPFSLQ
jgi:hypothetical protein